MTAWQVIDLTTPGMEGKVDAKRGHIRANGESIAHLDDALSILVVEDTHLEIHTCLYTAAAKAGVPVVYCDHFGKPLGIMLPNSPHTRVAARHIAQINLPEPRRKRAWQAVVRAKIDNQATVVAGTAVESKLRDMSREVKSGDSSNREAQAARAYWSEFFDESFRRNSDGTDEVNGALNYGYTVIRGAMAQAIVATGLWPTVGIHHTSRENAWCLVDDLMEPFRPAVDRAALIVDSFPSPEARQQLVAVLDAKFDDTTTRVAIQESAEAYALYVEGNADEFDAPRMRN